MEFRLRTAGHSLYSTTEAVYFPGSGERNYDRNTPDRSKPPPSDEFETPTLGTILRAHRSATPAGSERRLYRPRS